LQFSLSDDKKTSYRFHFGPQSVYFNLLNPTYILLPLDTLKISYNLNNMVGMQFADKYDQKYLDQKANYEPGKYKLYIQTEKNGKTLVSNEVEFEVTDIDAEDKSILELSKLKRYDEIIKKFPFNSLTEYVFIEKIKYLRYESYLKAEKKQDTKEIKDSIVTTIYEFLYKYPESYYGYRMVGEFVHQLKDNFENMDDLINYLKSNFTNSTFSKYLNTNSIKSGLRKFYYE